MEEKEMLETGKDKKQGKAKEITAKQYRKLFLFLSFFVPLEMMLMVFARSIVYPFGDECLLNSDLYHQYFPFFQEFVNKIRAGEGIFYSWNMAMGMNFYVVYAYYLASPLNWLAFLFPNEYLLEFVSYLVVFKVGLAGLTSYLFFVNRSREKDSVRAGYFALLFSFCYAMSGYVAAYVINIMWIDCVVIAPLILLGLERLVKDGKIGVYVTALAFCIYTNFYLSILVCIFLVLYFLLLIITEPRKKGAIIRFALGSLLAGGLAAVILVPIACYKMDSSIVQDEFPTKWKAYFSVFKVLARHCMLIRRSGDNGIFPNVYCGAAVFLFLPLYVMNKGISLKKKLVSIILVVFMLLSFSIDGLDYIWHGMNHPWGFPARQSFLYILLLLSMGYDCVMQIDQIKKKMILIASAIAVAFLVLTKLQLQNEDFHEWDWLITLIFVVGYVGCLIIYCLKNSQEARERLALISYVLIIVELTLNMSETSVMTTERDRIFVHQKDYQALYERNKDSDEGLQRFESVCRVTENDASLYGYPSGSVFSSMLNTKVADFYAKMGMQHGKGINDYKGATPFSLALMNDSYMFSSNGYQENELNLLADQENDIYLYKSRFALPFGYVGPIGYDLNDQEDAIKTQNNLVKQLGIEDDLFFEEYPVDGEELLFETNYGGYYYAVLHNDDISYVTVMRNNTDAYHFERQGKNYVIDLGDIQLGESLIFSKTYEKESKDKLSVSLYCLNMEVLKKAIETLGQEQLSQIRIEESLVEGHLELKNSGRLIVTVPYDKGWTIYVNGKKTEPVWFGDAFMALDLQSGTYDIEMHYFPPGLKFGVLISVICLLIFLGYLFIYRNAHKLCKINEKHNEND